MKINLKTITVTRRHSLAHGAFEEISLTADIEQDAANESLEKQILALREYIQGILDDVLDGDEG